MKLAFLALFATIVLAQATRLDVTMNVFSGTEDPSWVGQGALADEILKLLPEKSAEMRPIPWYRM